MKELLKDWGGMASALIATITLLGLVIRPIRKFITDHRATDLAQANEIQQIKSTQETLVRHQHETWLATLRHSIFSESLPLVERVNAGETYIAQGGNGAAKIQHDENVKKFRKERGGSG